MRKMPAPALTGEMSRVRKGDLNGAIADYNQAIQLNPKEERIAVPCCSKRFALSENGEEPSAAAFAHRPKDGEDEDEYEDD